jgi:peptidyl-prolyl cis-trans isomerase C
MENKILANVGGTPIYESDIDDFIATLGKQGASYNNPEGRKMVLGQLIDSKLLLLDARRNLLETEAAFRQQLARLKDNLLVNYAADKVISAVSLATDEDAQKFYDENTDKFVGQETVNASHILVDSEEKALSVYEQICSGNKSFEEAAREYSSCPSGQSGGSLGDFGRGQMVPEFEAAAFSMQVGEVTAQPVKTQFGYHLIKLNSKTAAEPTPFADVKEPIKNMLTGEKQKKAFESKINQLKIMYPVDMNV